MKKILALLIVLTLVVSMFTGCEFPELPFGPETPDDQVTPDDGNNDQNNDTTTEGSTLEDAKTVLRDLYKDKLATTAVNFTVVTQVMVGEDKYEVIWSTNNDKIVVGEPDEATKSVTIAVPSQAVEKIEYVLTATIKAADGTTLEVTFDAAVPKFEVNSHADYMAAVKDDELTIMGVVVGINSVARGNKYNHLFLADTSVDGGYYCYKVTTDPSDLGIELGMTVAVTGKMSPYNGMQEIINGQVEVLDTTIRSFDTLDITDKFAAGADLGAYVGLPVSIKGVTLGSQDLETANSQYLYFSIGEKQAYVRTYITDFPVDLQADRDNVKATIDADHAAHFGYKADVEGILVLFSGNPYLIPTSVTPFTNYQEVQKTPAEKVAAEIGELKFDASYSNDAVIDLLLTGKYYDDVTLTWATSDATNAAIADGKLTLKVPNETTTVTITVTVACGEVTQTKEFTIKLSKTITTITDALAIGAAKEHNTYTEEKYIVAGIIKEVYNTTYGNMYLVDEFGNTFTVYGTYSADGANRYDAMEAKPVAGDYVVIIGILGQYNGTAQMKNGWIQSFTTPITIPQANELGNTFEKNQYTEDKKVITGEITEVQNATYGNVVIKDTEGNSILVYGLYSANGVVRYDAMATKPAVGDTITVLGIIGKYNAPQMKNGWLIGYTAGAGETPAPHEHNFVEGKCECGAEDPNYQPPSGGDTPSVFGEIVFDFGANGAAGTHNDGTDIGTGKSFTSGSYTLTLTDASKAYTGGFDKAGNSILKFGTSSVIGTVTFVVPSEVNSIVIYAARYKSYADNNIIVINGTSYELAKNSDDGEYEAITIDTTTNKTVTIASSTAAAKPRCVVNTIVWVVGEGGNGGETPAPHEHNFVEGKCECGAEDPNYVAPETPAFGVIDAPVAGTAYKFGMVQGKLNDGKVYYLKGGMSGYYMATTTNVDEAIDVYLEATEGGYYLYAMINGTKTYINMVVSGTHVNGAYEATASTVYTYDAESKTVIATVNDAPYWFGTRNDNTYTTVGPCATSYNGFYCQFYGAIGETPAPHEHNFVEGKCECGATDPTYQPPHEHNFVEGKCECGAEDPNYQPPTGDGKMSIADVLAAPEGTVVTFTGTVHSFYEEWSSYNNCSPYIVDEAGNKILVFRTTTKVTIGDVVTVTGTVTLYGTSNQIAQSGSTVTIDVPHVCSTWTAATCGKDSACTVCGAAGTDKATGEHTYVDGICSVCGASSASVQLAGELSFANKSNRTTFTTSQQVWVANGITLTNDKSASTSNVADYANPARFYASSKITVAYTGMVKIEFVCNSPSYATALKNSISGATVSIDGSTVTVVFDEPVDSFVIAKLTAQVRMNSIKIYVAG